MRRSFTLRCWRDAALILLTLGALATALLAVDAGSRPQAGLALLLGPVALGAATGGRRAALLGGGEFDGWRALGRSDPQLLAPLLLSATLVGLLALVFPAPSSWAALPAPLAAGLPGWSGAEWTTAPPDAWTTEPGRLWLPQLVERWLAVPPVGARAQVDAGELVRRAGLALAWPGAVLCGGRWSGPGAALVCAAALAATALLATAVGLS